MATTLNLTPFTPAGHQDYDALIGRDVFTRDGEKVGTLKTVFHPNLDFEQSRGRHYFLLEPGLMKDWFGGLDETYIPENAISGTTGEGVYLNLSEDEIKQQRWEKPATIGSYRRV